MVQYQGSDPQGLPVLVANEGSGVKMVTEGTTELTLLETTKLLEKYQLSEIKKHTSADNRKVRANKKGKKRAKNTRNSHDEASVEYV